MTRIYLGILLAIGIGSIGFFGWNWVSGLQETITNQAETIALQSSALRSTNEAIDRLEGNIERTNELNATLRTQLDEAETRVGRLRTLLSDHDLTRLAAERPGLIEERINEATMEVFRDLERITSPN